jgi:hypothetical protein
LCSWFGSLFQQFDIVNTRNTRAATKRRFANGSAFVACRKVPELPWLHKGHQSSALVPVHLLLSVTERAVYGASMSLVPLLWLNPPNSLAPSR